MSKPENTSSFPNPNSDSDSNTGLGSNLNPIFLNPSLQLAAAIKIPPFWTNRPDLWFLQVETQFRLKGITSEQTKYDYIISSLPSEAMEIVADIVMSPPDQNKYSYTKSILISRCQDTEEKRLDALLNKIELGDMKPSELFRQMETLARTNSLVNNELLKKLWQNKLPSSIQPTIIAIESTHSQEDIFKIADKIYDSTDRPKIFPIDATVGEPGTSYAFKDKSENSEMKRLLQSISKRLDRLELDRSRSNRRQNFSGRARSQSRSRSRPHDRIRSNYCWYHKRYGNRAQKCLPNCSYGSNLDSQSETKN